MIKYLLLALTLPLLAHADLTIFDVRKNLPMSDTDPVYRDFYIDGGSESGLTVGMVVTVERKLPLYDSYLNHSAGDLLLKVAKVKIIQVQRGLSVARLHSEFTREGSPLLEDPFIMVGDILDLSSATSDKKADNADSAGTAATAAAAAAAEPTGGSVATAAHIVVNSVELSSRSPKPENTPLPQKVEAPALQ